MTKGKEDKIPKEQLEREIAEGIEQFLKNGGKIEYIKSNKSQVLRAKRKKVVDTKKEEANKAKSLLDRIMNDESL
jgi:UDP-2,3-diacylglucosamine pyrophosphatase LpxH